MCQEPWSALCVVVLVMAANPAPRKCFCDLLVIVEIISLSCVSLFTMCVFACELVNMQILSHTHNLLFFARPRWPCVFVCLVGWLPIFTAKVSSEQRREMI